MEKDDRDLDSYLCSKDFLQELVKVGPGDPGLILQLELPEEKQRVFPLTDVFPAFRVALAQIVRWPGILLWTDRDSVFLPFPTRERERIVDAAKWIFNNLAHARHDLGKLKKQYGENNLQDQETIVNIIQLSDLHLGSTEAKERLPWVLPLVKNLIAELRNTFEDLGGKTKIIPIVSGDIIQSPEEDNVHTLRLFMDPLSNLGTEPPIFVLGNHDVKKDGWLHRDLSAVLKLPEAGYRISWFDDVRIGIVCFNSVIESRYATREENRKDYDLIAVLHHHPLPVPPPDWYKKEWYEKSLSKEWLPARFRTVELEDAQDFVNFLEARRFVCALHGHKHIPKINETPIKKIPVFACGSTVSKVKTTEGIYMSMNVVTLAPSRRKLSGRLLVQRIVGGELQEEDQS